MDDTDYKKILEELGLESIYGGRSTNTLLINILLELRKLNHRSNQDE